MFSIGTRGVLTIVAGVIALILFRAVESDDIRRFREIVGK